MSMLTLRDTESRIGPYLILPRFQTLKSGVPTFLESAQDQKANRYVYAGWVPKHDGISSIT